MFKFICLFGVLIISLMGCLSRKATHTLTQRDTVVNIRVDTFFYQPLPQVGSKFSFMDLLNDTLKFDFDNVVTSVIINRNQEDSLGRVRERITVKNNYIPTPIYLECTDTLIKEKITIVPGLGDGKKFPLEIVFLALMAVAQFFMYRAYKKAKGS